MKYPLACWQDSLLWSIRPDCRHDAQSVIDHLASNVATENGGLHRDNLTRRFNSDVARWLDMDELPIDYTESGVAIISVVGPIVNVWTPFTANYPALKASFETCRENARVKAVIVRLKTPGGTVSGLQECADSLELLANTKPTIAQNDGGTYSAGYFLACKCGEIRSGATDHIGNIGTVTSLYDYSKMFQAEGIRAVVKRTGPIKGVGIFGDVVTDAMEAFLEELTQQHFGHFRDAVMTGRNMTSEQCDAVSDGRWWLGESAVENKIIDRVATYESTLREAQQFAVQN